MKRIFSLFGPKQPPIHSHAMTRLSDNATFGSTSAETFSQRKTIEKNRQTVASYRYADIHQAGEVRTSRSSSRGTDTETLTTQRDFGPRVARPVPSTPQRSSTNRPSFHEPTPRKYNPYG